MEIKKEIIAAILSFISFFSVLWANVLLNLMPLGSPGSTAGKWMLLVMYLFYGIVFLFNMFVVSYCRKTQEEQQTSKIPVWISTAGTILFLVVALFLSVGITIVQVTGGV